MSEWTANFDSGPYPSAVSAWRGPPTLPVEIGKLYYESDGSLMIFDGTVWLKVTNRNLDGSLEYVVWDKITTVHLPNELFEFTD